MTVGESITNGTLWDTRRTPRGNTALPFMGALLDGLRVNPANRRNRNTIMNENVEYKESSLVGDSSKNSKEGSRQVQLLSLEAPHAATEQYSCWQGASETPMIWEEHLTV
jgi:hypothetical protein